MDSFAIYLNPGAPLILAFCLVNPFEFTFAAARRGAPLVFGVGSIPKIFTPIVKLIAVDVINLAFWIKSSLHLPQNPMQK